MDEQKQAGAGAGGSTGTPQAAQPATNKAPATNDVPNVPASWPGAFGAYKHSKKAVMTNLGTLIAIWLVTVVVTLIFDYLLKNVGSLLAIIVDSLTGAAFALTYLAGVRGQRMEFGDVFGKAVSLWWKMFLLYLLIVLSIMASILLLVVPFFFVFPRLTLATYFLVDRDMGPVDAYKASWDATKGNVGKVYGIVGATILMALLCITIIGIPFSIYFLIMYGAAYAVLYEFLHKSQPVAGTTSAAPQQTPPSAPAPTPPAAG